MGNPIITHFQCAHSQPYFVLVQGFDWDGWGWCWCWLMALGWGWVRGGLARGMYCFFLFSISFLYADETGVRTKSGIPLRSFWNDTAKPTWKESCAPSLRFVLAPGGRGWGIWVGGVEGGGGGGGAEGGRRGWWMQGRRGTPLNLGWGRAAVSAWEPDPVPD